MGENLTPKCRILVYRSDRVFSLDEQKPVKPQKVDEIWPTIIVIVTLRRIFPQGTVQPISNIQYSTTSLNTYRLAKKALKCLNFRWRVPFLVVSFLSIQWKCQVGFEIISTVNNIILQVKKKNQVQIFNPIWIRAKMQVQNLGKPEAPHAYRSDAVRAHYTLVRFLLSSTFS